MQYARILFTIPIAIPSKDRFKFHNNIMDDVLNLDAPTFCRDVVASVSAWYAAKSSDPVVQANVPRLLRLHPSGLAPYMIGVPLIA
jgi:hypothetical protein